MLTKAFLIQQFKESIPAWRSESTKLRYPLLVGHFIDFAGVKPTYDKTDAMKFLNHIINSGLSKNYARWSAYILKGFYESLGITFPLDAGDLPPQPGLDEIIAPVFTANYVHKFIQVVKNKGSPQMKAYLALSTTYGLRRTEMANISSKDIHNSVIEIHTIKGGSPREHIIPVEIEPYLDYKFKPVHPQTMVNIFLRMQELAKLKHGEREGFHSVRRSLVTELLNAGVPIHIAYLFMGWKLSTRLGIIGVYARPSPTEVDKVVMAKHPFLLHWR